MFGYTNHAKQTAYSLQRATRNATAKLKLLFGIQPASTATRLDRRDLLVAMDYGARLNWTGMGERE